MIEKIETLSEHHFTKASSRTWKWEKILSPLQSKGPSAKQAKELRKAFEQNPNTHYSTVPDGKWAVHGRFSPKTDQIVIIGGEFTVEQVHIITVMAKFLNCPLKVE